MRFLRWWWQMVQLEHFELEDGPRKVMSNSPLRIEEKSCSKSRSFLVSNLGQKRTKGGLSTYWPNTMTSSTLEDEEMGCTEAIEHKIEVTNPKPFKERPRNIPPGLLEEVEDHLHHMLNVGVIRPSKLAWSNAVVLVQKRYGGLRFCINF